MSRELGGLDRVITNIIATTSSNTLTSMDNDLGAFTLQDFTEELEISGGKAGLTVINGFDKGDLSGVMGVDSSSRFIDTPYFFLGIGSVSVYNRVLRTGFDCPDIYGVIYGSRRSGCEWLLVIGNGLDKDGRFLEQVVTRNPAGYPYTAGYNRLMALNELRLRLESYALNHIVDDYGRIILVDGPIYHIPSIFSVYLRVDRYKSESLRKYYESWRILLRERINALNKLVGKGFRILGIVKRLEYSTILSRIDPLNILRRNARINDYTYLSIVANNIAGKGGAKPFILGSFKYHNKEIIGELPERIGYYVGLPRRREARNSSNYVFYRAELLENDPELLNIVLTDSLGSGALLPLTILLVDSRAKKLSGGLRNYLLRLIENKGIPLTYDMRRSIEGLYSGW